MTDNNAARPVLTDDQIEALAKKHIAPHADRLDAIMANPVPYQQTEQFRRVKALIVDVLSNLRAPVADEREPLPCPFCGGRAFATYKTDEDDIRWHSVHCRTECRGYGKHGSEKDAIAAWNTRTTLLRKYPNDEEIIDLAVEPLGIDCDRMPHGVVVFARNLLSRYAAPQASEADALIDALGQCRDAFPLPDIVGSKLDLLWQEAMSDPSAVPAYIKARAALSAQPGAQKTGGSDAN